MEIGAKEWAVLADLYAEGTGETNKVERVNNTLRQRLARFVRKTLAFSKSSQMHGNCLLLFLHEYNRYCVKRFKREPTT